mgnify:FL=1
MITPPRTNYKPRRCVTNAHVWHALCDCGDAAICLRCGTGQGTVPCACQANSGVTIPRCHCCGRPLAPVARHGAWCDACVDGLLIDATLLSAGDREAIGATVAWLFDKGCLTLARFVGRGRDE